MLNEKEMRMRIWNEVLGNGWTRRRPANPGSMYSSSRADPARCILTEKRREAIQAAYGDLIEFDWEAGFCRVPGFGDRPDFRIPGVVKMPLGFNPYITPPLYAVVDTGGAGGNYSRLSLYFKGKRRDFFLCIHDNAASVRDWVIDGQHAWKCYAQNLVKRPWERECGKDPSMACSECLLSKLEGK